MGRTSKPILGLLTYSARSGVLYWCWYAFDSYSCNELIATLLADQAASFLSADTQCSPDSRLFAGSLCYSQFLGGLLRYSIS